ncbi:essential protein of the mitochondrial inner membrane, component of the mitochondrial import system [Nadsonia fulvescens var. elongata DSM 6958]|uniref:Mitochondrial import inner membrane translocase subunit TIM23 n=1 Tax=Nadsonia fulvescens var. elongata DSM 6958 TaxID=857566 RepID=A0A1E3PP53_9ASCO|nr:essential protein of the mitochondrial inner membrane, component of the mitochondrial import system [Nadsonia fulvescens var. elongata DSM 6958]
MSWLFGGNSKKEQQPEQKPEVQEQAFSFDSTSAQDVSSFLSTPMDTSRLHPLAGLNDTLEYLNIDDEALTDLQGAQGLIPSRGWTDDLCYGSGGAYLTGLGLGGSYGFIEGIKAIPSGAPTKIRINTVLNHITKRGPFLGNSAGVLALGYNLVNSLIGYQRGKHDAANSVAAGAITGALFKATKGTKPMFIASGLMASAAGAWSLIKELL